jgi:hypothetical protein
LRRAAFEIPDERDQRLPQGPAAPEGGSVTDRAAG